MALYDAAFSWMPLFAAAALAERDAAPSGPLASAASPSDTAPSTAPASQPESRSHNPETTAAAAAPAAAPTQGGDGGVIGWAEVFRSVQPFELLSAALATIDYMPLFEPATLAAALVAAAAVLPGEGWGSG